MQRSKHIKLSSLNHTWIFDLDGTIISHNSHLSGEDIILPGVIEFWGNIADGDLVIIITARKETYREQTIATLINNKIRFDHIIFDAPVGERILFNDIKPSGLETAKAINVNRNEGLLGYHFKIMDNEFSLNKDL